jgi:hypothetical protein
MIMAAPFWFVSNVYWRRNSYQGNHCSIAIARMQETAPGQQSNSNGLWALRQLSAQLFCL